MSKDNNTGKEGDGGGQAEQVCLREGADDFGGEIPNGVTNKRRHTDACVSLYLSRTFLNGLIGQRGNSMILIIQTSGRRR